MREEVKKWIGKAEKDLKIAEYNLNGNMLDAVVFYSQQAAEKALKALLLKKIEKFPKTHDLTKLAKLIKSPDRIIELCSKINPGYIVSRYPDQSEEYSKKECEDILSWTKEILRWTKENLN